MFISSIFIESLMKKLMRNALNAGLLGFWLIGSQAYAKHTKNLETYVAENQSKNITNLTGILPIPKINDLVIIEENWLTFKEDDYCLLMEEQQNEKIELDEESRIQFQNKLRQNLCSIAVYKESKDENGELKPRVTSWGSGFYINKDGFLLTATHILERHRRYNLAALSFTRKMEPMLNGLDVLAFSLERDIALCKIESTNEISDIFPINLRNKNIDIGQEIVGLLWEYRLKGHKDTTETYNVNGKKIRTNLQNIHPFAVENTDSGYYLSASFSECNPGFVFWDGYVGFIDNFNYKNQEAEKNINLILKKIETENLRETYYVTPFIGKCESGNSGSVIFDRSGNVIGIMSIANEEVNQGYMVPASTIRDFLEQYQRFKPKKKAK